MHPLRIIVALAFALGVCLPALARSGEIVLVIQNHRFSPQEIQVPAGQRLQLVIDNRDATPEEFESQDLRREKIVPGNSRATLWVGPLPKGEYGFFGEFHPETAQGKLVAQ